ncbi:MAG: hypothetical protein OXF64_06835 [bacterium]|nr:hypothetical protein [bacterium]MCY4195175.1 hypothetical protein [bacterium]MCY4272706.1 hypothetical protein [bacterium]
MSAGSGLLAASLAGFHDWFSWVVMLANTAAGAWALGADLRPRWRGWPLWAFIAAAQSTIFAQVIVGVVHQNRSGADPGDLHRLYGFAAIAAVAIVYAYRAQLAHRRELLYAGGSFFLAGLSIRAMILS